MPPRARRQLRYRAALIKIVAFSRAWTASPRSYMAAQSPEIFVATGRRWRRVELTGCRKVRRIRAGAFADAFFADLRIRRFARTISPRYARRMLPQTDDAPPFRIHTRVFLIADASFTHGDTNEYHAGRTRWRAMRISCSAFSLRGPR